MAQQLITDIAVTLAGGASSTYAHSLEDNSGALTPDDVRPDRSTPLQVTAVDAANITVLNPTGVSHTANFRAMYHHSVQRRTGLSAFLWNGGSLESESSIAEPLRIHGLTTTPGPAKTSQMTIGDGWCDADDHSGVILQYTSLQGLLSPINAGTVGANGIDVGPIAQGGYYVWLIGDDTGATVAGLLSLSSTAPTLPTGYTKKRLVGWCAYTGTAFLDYVSYAEGTALKCMWWEAQTDRQILNAVGAGQATSLTDVPLETAGGTPLAPDTVTICPAIGVVVEKLSADTAYVTGSGTSGHDTYGVGAGQRTSYEVIQTAATGTTRLAYRATAATGGAETNIWFDYFIVDRSGEAI